MTRRTFSNDGKNLLRFIAFSSFLIKGSYRYKDVFQIMSLPDTAPKPKYAMGKHPFVIEYVYDTIGEKELERTLSEYPNSDSFDERMLESRYDLTKQDEILCVLSVITKYHITKEENGKKWVLCNKDEERISIECGVGYFWKGMSQFGENLTDIDIGNIPEVQYEQYYSKDAFLNEPFMLSDSTSWILDKYFSLDEARKEAFLSACVLFERSSRTWAISHSLAYIGFVSGIEALMEYDNKDVKTEKCDDCGQPKYKVRQKFLAFANCYGEDSCEFRNHVDKLYNKRSQIGHAGKLLSHDMVGKISGLVVEMNDGIELKNLQRVVRIMMINWLTKV